MVFPRCCCSCSVSEQRRVELRIMGFNLFRDDSRFNLHFRRHHFQHLHK